MSLANCFECWDNPCTCGHDYAHWPSTNIIKQIKMLQKLLKTKKLKHIAPREVNKKAKQPIDKLFKVGQVIRYGDGPTALMKITTVIENHGDQPRYYGTQCYGTIMGCYHSDAKKPTINDMQTWEKESEKYK